MHAEGHTWGSYPTEPAYDAEWVDATVLEFLESVNSVAPAERRKSIQCYIKGAWLSYEIQSASGVTSAPFCLLKTRDTPRTLF
ncbi:hypothetical protein PG990_006299 [Apiospora arundinis]